MHELVLGQCNQPLFVAHYQLPRAELFYCSTMAFCCVIVQLSQTQRESKQMLRMHTRTKEQYTQLGEREKEKITIDSQY